MNMRNSCDSLRFRNERVPVRLDGDAVSDSRSAALVAQSAERGQEIRLTRAAKRRRQQRLLGRRGERVGVGREPRRHLNVP